VELGPYFERGAPPTTNTREAFLRVRVSDDLKPSGYVAVYLDSGTQLLVRSRDLLRFNTAVERNAVPPDSCSTDD
jgi:hypothetical protein